MEWEGHIPNPNLALAPLIELMVSWTVDHGCVVSPTSGLCSPYQIHSALTQLMSYVVYISKSDSQRFCNIRLPFATPADSS